jgi:hypothetical protein
LQHINPSTSPNELNTTLTPHSIIHGDACFAYFNKIWGIPPALTIGMWPMATPRIAQHSWYLKAVWFTLAFSGDANAKAQS